MKALPLTTGVIVLILWALFRLDVVSIHNKAEGGLAVSEWSESVDIFYRISYTNNLEKPISVTLRTSGQSSGVSRFFLCTKDGWSDISNCANNIDTPVFHNESSTPLKATKLENDIWEVTHKPGAILKIKYNVLPNQNSATSKYNSYLRPIINKQYFYAIGHAFLLVPEHLFTDKKAKIQVSYHGFDEQGWQTISSYSNSTKSFQLNEKFDRFLRSIFVAGDFKHLRKSINGHPIHFAFLGEKWNFTKEQMADLFVKILKTERNFFSDYNYPYYFVGVLPVKNNSKWPAYVNAANLTNSFSLVLSENVTLDQNAWEYNELLSLLAHECFHNWNGNILSLGSEEENIYWFSEGFTNHYSRKMLLKSGLYSQKDYIKSLNMAAKGYFTSPVVNSPNKEIVKNFHRSDDIRALPYLRGDMLAYLLDYEIRKTSDGKRNLDDFMKAITGNVRETKELQSINVFKLIEQFTSNSFRAYFENLVQSGSTIEFPTDLLDPCLRITFKQKSNILIFQKMENIPDNCIEIL